MRRVKTAEQHRPYVDLVDRPAILARQDPIAFRRIRQQIVPVREWFATRCGWPVVLTRDLVRAVKTPARPAPGLGFRWAQEPLDYELFTWILWYAEQVEGDQFLLSALVREIEAQANALLGEGHLDWNRYEQRQSLRRAVAGLEELGALRRVDDGLEGWVQRGAGEGLYEFTPLVPHLYVHLPPDLFTRLAVLADAAALEEPAAISAPPEQRLYRTLLLSPALYRADDPEAFALLLPRDRRRTIVRDLHEHLGWDLEVTESYACLLRPSASEASESFLFPFRGALCHVILLLLARVQEMVAAGACHRDACDRVRLPLSALTRELVDLRSRWGEHWGSTLGKLSAPALAEAVLGALRDWDLLAGPDADGQVLVLPLAARFRGVYRDDGLTAEGDDA